MPTRLTLQEIKTVLEQGHFEALLGVAESNVFECKSAPYQLREEREKLELAKDVSALANAQGGMLLLGAETERDEQLDVDVVRALHPFPRQLVNDQQYRQVLMTWLCPSLWEIEIEWFPSGMDPQRGFVGILLPPPAANKGPFLVTRDLTAKGRKGGILFGYVQRRGAHSVPMSAQDIHTLIRDGLQFATFHKEVLQTFRAESRLSNDAVQLTEDQLRLYHASYSDPFVQHVRKALNGYLDGTNVGSATPELLTDALRSSMTYLDSPFVVLAIDRGMFGGKIITLMFQERPDQVFHAWVYKAGDDYDLRGFWPSRMSPREILQLARQFKRFLEDKQHSI